MEYKVPGISMDCTSVKRPLAVQNYKSTLKGCLRDAQETLKLKRKYSFDTHLISCKKDQFFSFFMNSVKRGLA